MICLILCIFMPFKKFIAQPCTWLAEIKGQKLKGNHSLEVSAKHIILYIIHK